MNLCTFGDVDEDSDFPGIFLFVVPENSNLLENYKIPVLPVVFFATKIYRFP